MPTAYEPKDFSKNCPYCGSTKIVYSGKKFDDGTIAMRCNSCRSGSKFPWVIENPALYQKRIASAGVK